MYCGTTLKYAMHIVRVKKKKKNQQITKPDYYIDYLFKKDEHIKTSNRPRQYLVAEFLLNTTTSALALREWDWLGKMSLWDHPQH